MNIIILAAGVGSRLGNPFPKPLTPLANGQTIMQRQIESLRVAFPGAQITAVVGFKKATILEAHPEICYVYNPDFGDTNTSKSLLKGLQLVGNGGVLWLNGDVVFDDSIWDAITPVVQSDASCVVVDRGPTGEEEVKYRLNAEGNISELSKQVEQAEGEAVGINYISSADRAGLEKRLTECAAQDYFERAIELMIDGDAVAFKTVDVSAMLCMEVDFREDLQAVNDALSSDGT